MKIEDTGLGSFGVPAFTNYMSKSFDKDMGLARRYYPHKVRYCESCGLEGS